MDAPFLLPPARPAAAESPRHMPASSRLLLPLRNGADAACGTEYAIRRRAQGRMVAVCLLHVEETPAQWQALVGGSAAPPARPRRHHDVFARTLRRLEGLDIEYAAYIRSGPIVFTILDAAEELACGEIVVPAPGTGLMRLWSRDIVLTLLARQRAIPVVTVDAHGMAAA